MRTHETVWASADGRGARDVRRLAEARVDGGLRAPAWTARARRWVRIWSIPDAWVMRAMIRIGPRHVGHASGSTSTICKDLVDDIVAGYDDYSQLILRAPRYPNPTNPTGPNVDWFDGAILAIGTSFLAVVAMLPAVGGLVRPPRLDPVTINSGKKLRDALEPTLDRLSVWVDTMIGVATEIDRLSTSCASKYAMGLVMMKSLQEAMKAIVFPTGNPQVKPVCAVALSWIRTFFYWQTTIAAWEQPVFDNCGSGGAPPAPYQPMRLELGTSAAQTLVVVIQQPEHRERSSGYARRQIPPPIWPPWQNLARWRAVLHSLGSR